MTSSVNSPTSKVRSSRFEVLLVSALLVTLISACGWWTYRQGYILYYGDAQAHLNNSRSILDSRTPGYEQLGTVWLPVLHILCLPLVQSMGLWSSGLAGTIPVALCFVVAGVFLYLAAKHVYGSTISGVVVLACFALNPNVLYLSVIPMTEIVFLAGFSVLLYTATRFRNTGEFVLLVPAVLASWWMSLTRYDGWFLIPFAALWFAFNARHHRLRVLLVFLFAASAAPVYWMIHSWYETANALDFFNGPYSAKAIQQGRPYPGFHDWPKAFLYYGDAAQLCAGWGLVILGAAGLSAIRKSSALTACAFLLLPCAFYIWSIHSSGNPIHVPQLWPFSYYNTRYGIAFAFFAAFATGSLARYRFAVVMPLIAILPWLLHPARENWICWKESQVNSVARRSWTSKTAAFVNVNYRQGQGILAPFGDVAGIFCHSGVPLSEVLHEGGGPAWLATIKRPDLLHQQRWAIAQQGDVLYRSLTSHVSPYRLVHRIDVPDALAIMIYKRDF